MGRDGGARRTFDEAKLHEHVGDEWSFIQTLRHLCFASDAWVGRMVQGNPRRGTRSTCRGTRRRLDGIPWDREARPSLDEALAVRRERQTMVGP